MGPKTRNLIRRVALRQSIGSGLSRFRLFLLILAGLYAALLLSSRVLALIPDYFEPTTLLGLTAAAMVLALAFHRWPGAPDAARRIDGHSRTKDLYLTASLIESSAGQYKPLVVRNAEERAGEIEGGRSGSRHPVGCCEHADTKDHAEPRRRVDVDAPEHCA